MKTPLFLFAGAIALICGCNKPAAVVSERDKFQDDARFSALQEITNEVVGVRAITDFSLNDSDQVISNWHASATVEFVNQAGGVDRTNLNFIFRERSDFSSRTFVACFPAWINPDSPYKASDPAGKP